MANYSCAGIFHVRIGGAAVHAPGIEAVMATAGHVLQSPCSILGTHYQVDTAPGFSRIEPIEGVTRSHTCLAASAGVEIDLERILLSGTGRPQWNRVAIHSARRQRGALV